MAVNPRNLYAITNDAAYSVQVKFQNNNQSRVGKVYEYVTDIEDIKVGDYCVVMAPNFDEDMDVAGSIVNQVPKLVQVVSKEDGLGFDLHDSRAYGWIVAKVYTSYYTDKVLPAIEDAAKLFKTTQRKQARASMKAELDKLLLESVK